MGLPGFKFGSSATSGPINQSFANLFGAHTAGSEPVPTWLWLVIGAGLLFGVLFFLRKGGK